MAIHRLPGDHLYLSCDTEGCTIEGPTKRGVTEDELLDIAEAEGWNIERDWGLHYCPLTTMHECCVCGAPTQDSIGPPVTLTDRGEWVRESGEATHYCREHWPL